MKFGIGIYTEFLSKMEFRENGDNDSNVLYTSLNKYMILFTIILEIFQNIWTKYLRLHDTALNLLQFSENWRS